MLELALVLGVLLGFFAIAVTLSFQIVTVIGLVMVLLGLVMGVPTGFWYHVILYRLVSPKISLPRRWWWSPSDLHRHLTEAERCRIDPWYRIGGVGFMFCLLGGLAAIAGLLIG